MAAAALQYPRRKMLAIVGAARMVRFTVLGVLALLLRPSDPEVGGWRRRAVDPDRAGGGVHGGQRRSRSYGWIKRSRSAGGSPAGATSATAPA